jgi:L-alanine-DL-glutamate epimerase-like enolase superfamily enzyme
MTRWQFREVLERGLAQFVNPDICWCGGLTEARKIAALADTHYVPIAPHNCGGPVLHAASVHLAASVPNVYILESVRRHYLQDYAGLVTATCRACDGWLHPPESPGLGLDLDPALLSRPGLAVRTVST